MLSLRLTRFTPLILLFFLLPVNLTGQQMTGTRYIHWTPVQGMLIGDQQTEVFHFRNASYELNTLFPNYYELLKIENNSEYDVRIQNPVFQEADYEAIRNIKNLEDIPSDIRVTSRVSILRKEKHLQVSFVPLRRNSRTGRVEMLTQFELVLVPAAGQIKSSPALARAYSDHSVLASGKWVRIKLQTDGVYSMSYEQLREIGIDNPANVRVYGNAGGMLPMQNDEPRHDDLVENAIVNAGGRIIFYGRSPHVWKFDETNDFFYRVLHDYSDWTYYYLTSDLGPGTRVQDAEPPASPANYSTTSCDVLWHQEMDDINLIKSGREWYGEHFDIVTEQSFPVLLGSLIPEEDIRVRVSVVGRASAQTSMEVRANGNLLGSLSMQGTILGNYIASHASPASDLYSFQAASDDIDISLRQENF